MNVQRRTKREREREIKNIIIIIIIVKGLLAPRTKIGCRGRIDRRENRDHLFHLSFQSYRSSPGVMISFYWSNRDWLVCFLPRNCSCVIARDYEIDAIRFFFRSMHFSRSCFLLVCIPAKRRGEGRKGGKGRIFRKMNDWWSSENRSRENKEIRGFGTSRGVKSVYI